MSAPNGLTSVEAIPYGVRRWNGAIWADAWVDAYNAQLAKIARFHADGFDTTWHVEELYRLSKSFDYVGKEARA